MLPQLTDVFSLDHPACTLRLVAPLRRACSAIQWVAGAYSGALAPGYQGPFTARPASARLAAVT
jgi:hypothetical protein